SLAFAPEGDRLAVAEARGTYLLDAANGLELARFVGHEQHVLSVAFVDHATVLTGGVDATARLWDATPQHMVAELDVGDMEVGLRGAGDSIAIDPSGTRVLAGGRVGAAILDAATGHLVEWVTRAPNITAVAWASDGARVAFGDAGGQVALRSNGTTRTVVIAPDGDARTSRVVDSVAFSPDDRRLAVALSSHLVGVIDLDEPRVQTVSAASVGLGGQVAWGDGGLFAVALPDGGVSVHRGGTALAGLVVDPPVSEFTFAGADLLAGHYDGVIERIDTRGEHPTTRLLGHTAPISRLLSSPALLVSLSSDGTARVWDPAGAQLAMLQPQINGSLRDAVVLSPDLVATIDASGQSEAW